MPSLNESSPYLVDGDLGLEAVHRRRHGLPLGVISLAKDHCHAVTIGLLLVEGLRFRALG